MVCPSTMRETTGTTYRTSLLSTARLDDLAFNTRWSLKDENSQSQHTEHTELLLTIARLDELTFSTRSSAMMIRLYNRTTFEIINTFWKRFVFSFVESSAISLVRRRGNKKCVLFLLTAAPAREREGESEKRNLNWLRSSSLFLHMRRKYT